MNAAPACSLVPHRQRHRHHHRHGRRYQEKVKDQEEPEEKRPKVNPIFLWASQHDQRIVEVRCEDYDKRNRIKLTKTAQGWRSIPRTASNTYPVLLTSGELVEMESKDISEKENGLKKDEKLRRLEEFSITERVNCAWMSSEGVKGKAVKDIIKEKDEIKERDELQKEDENGKNDKIKRVELAERERMRNRVEIRKKDTVIERNRIRNGGEFRKNDRKEQEVMEYVSLGKEINGWKLRKRRNDYQGQKRKRVMNEAEEVERNDDPVDEEAEKKREEASRKKRKCVDLDAMGKSRLMQPRVVLVPLQLKEKKVSGSKKEKGLQEFHKKMITEGVETYTYIETDERDEEEEEIERMKNIGRVLEEGIEEIVCREDGNESEKIGEKEKALKKDGPEDETDKRGGCNKDRINSYNTKNKIKSMEQSREEDFEDILKMLGTTSLSNSKLLSNFKNMKMLKELELSLAGMEHEVDERDINKMEKTQSEELIAGEKNLGTRQSFFVVENNNVISNKNTGSKNKVTNNHNVLNNNNIIKVPRNNLHLEKCLEELEMQNQAEVDKELDTIQSKTDNSHASLEEFEVQETDSSRILKALRNTPGLSISIATKPSCPKIQKPLKKSSPGGNISPDSQMEIREKSTGHLGLGEADKFSGLSIAIPTWSQKTLPPINPSSSLSKNRVESPESTVPFPRSEQQLQASDRMNDEDDCDSQVLEDIRKQKENYLRVSAQLKRLREELEAPIRRMHRNRNALLQMVTFRSNEAQAKKFAEEAQELIDDSKSQGSNAVSPQPSGIPCSPTSKRSSSTSLERLLPSPPCSVSCSEDAKTDLTLKGILSIPSTQESRVFEKSKDQIEILAKLQDRQRYEANPEGWRNPSRDSGQWSIPTDSGAFDPRIPELRISDIQRSYQNMNSGRCLLNEAQNSFLSVQQPVQYLMSKQMKRSKMFHSKDHRHQQGTYVDATSTIPDIPLSPANQLRELLQTSGHLIPDPLLVPRNCLPGLAAAPSIEIPKLLMSRPELRLPEALTKPELLRDPDILVISLAHLQYVLDQGQSSFTKSGQSQVHNLEGNINNVSNENESSKSRPKLSCKPIGKLMPAPIDLSRSRKNGSYPPLLRVRSGLLKQEAEVSSTASNLEEHQLWHPLFSR